MFFCAATQQGFLVAINALPLSSIFLAATYLYFIITTLFAASHQHFLAAT